MTLNIRCLNELKVQKLADFLNTTLDIDIFSITETRISNKQLKYITKQKFVNHEIFGTVDAKVKETGTLLIVKKELAKYISKIEKFNGRILKLEFLFPKSKRLSVISVYNKSEDSGHNRIETRVDINRKIMKMIKESKQKNHQIILMGDFNLHYKKYLIQKNSGKGISEQLKIFSLLEKEELFDVFKEVMEINDLALTKSHVIQSIKKGGGSRIDYIWVTKQIFDEIIKVNIKEFDDKETDHKLLVFKIVRDMLLPSQLGNRKKQIKMYRTKFFYEKLNEDNKEDIRIKAEDELKLKLLNKEHNEFTIDDKIEIYKEIIDTTKKEKVEHVEIKLTTPKEDTQIKDLEFYRIVRFFIQLRRKFKKNKGRESIISNWKKVVSHVIRILRKWNVDNFYYLKSYIYRKVLDKKYIEEMDELYEIFNTKLQVLMASIKEEKIKKAIEQRQKDLEFNQKRIIDNVMDREFRKINLDRVLTINSKGEEILIVDEQKIKEVVANHFQKCAGTVSVNKEIPEDWLKEYDSKNQQHISDSAYDLVMEKITIEEILEVVEELPIGKACGPSGITYEDIKLTIDPLKFFIQEIFNDILEYGKIPQQWLKANIYPIPKLKPWSYDLNNTRPITLLETLRKLFMKILTNRLSNVIVKHNILMGYQFAGLPM